MQYRQPRIERRESLNALMTKLSHADLADGAQAS